MKTQKINVVIGSWGSYNACNKRCLGSDWLCLNDFNNWEEIEKELITQGFELNGIDEELFIQAIDVELNVNYDYLHPKKLFNVVKDSGILQDNYLYKLAMAYMEVHGFKYFAETVEKNGKFWGDSFTLWENCDMEDVAYEYIQSVCSSHELFLYLKNYIDYEKVATDLLLSGFYEKTSYGVLED